TIIGSAFGETLGGGLGRDTLVGRAGNDKLRGHAGADTIRGGAGDDVIVIMADEGVGDVIDAGETGETRGDVLRVVGTSDPVLAGFDAAASGIEIWEGNGGHLRGTNAADHFDLSGLTAISGLTYTFGGDGDDTIIGSAFGETLGGGLGRDTLVGGAGDDLLTGGEANDTLCFAGAFGHDKITDFEPGADVISFARAIFSSFEDVISASSQQNTDVMITVDTDNSLLLSDVALESLNHDDFLFA
ncbi:MAG TPA: calcium-binding protein, partial [Pseudorhizobium sp.]|nr:calcium-binding protein [Pseudorhizobium sp.]